MQKWQVNRGKDIGYWLEYDFEHGVCSAEEAFDDFTMHGFLARVATRQMTSVQSGLVTKPQIICYGISSCLH